SRIRCAPTGRSSAFPEVRAIRRTTSVAPPARRSYHARPPFFGHREPVSDSLKITEIPVDGYERVVRGVDSRSGLHAIISVHDTTLGPAIGGLRMWPYASEDEGLFDVKRLSKGMTYKSAVAKTGLGGGKSVIIGDPKKVKSEALYLAMGRL